MPPKKKKAAKKKKDAGDEEFTVEQKNALFERRIEGLERVLQLRTEEVHRSRAQRQELLERVRQLHDDFETEKKERAEITADMTRQYKAMQKDLIDRINQLEGNIANLKDELELSRIALEQQRKEKDHLISLKEKEIAEQKQKMEDMAIEFGEMLKETLEKMSKRIDTSGAKFTEEDARGLAKEKMRDFEESQRERQAASGSGDVSLSVPS
eukprot:TRINITY_DN2934_c0_g1_i1.p1 TRINITY_DN2934_c0_g1~~TRINITY_DN2934_c0_g1_i1.p1  ORF type:complete len:211 (-),score=84.75 TRINITY_DN2934_c0_g1_i1:128-760(-)